MIRKMPEVESTKKLGRFADTDTNENEKACTLKPLACCQYVHKKHIGRNTTQILSPYSTTNATLTMVVVSVNDYYNTVSAALAAIVAWNFFVSVSAHVWHHVDNYHLLSRI